MIRTLGHVTATKNPNQEPSEHSLTCGLGGGDIGAGRSCLGVTGSLVVLAGGVVGRSILGICV